MLVALITIMILGGGGGILDFIADTQDNIKVVMEKGDRQKEVLGTLKAMKKRATAHNKVIKQTSKGLEKALSTDDDIDEIWEAYFAQRGAYNSEMLNMRFQLRDQLTREEWLQIFAGE